MSVVPTMITFFGIGSVFLSLTARNVGSGNQPSDKRQATHLGKRFPDFQLTAGERAGFRAIFPPSDLCTDNAAMIAAAGAALLRRGEAHGLDLNSFSRAPIGSAPWSPGGAA